MNRINLFRTARIAEAANRNNPAKGNFFAWGKTNFETTGGVAVFAALLIACSMSVGCSSNHSKPASSNNVSPSAPAQTLASSSVPAPVMPEPKPVAKKVVRKRPATVTYVDKTYGVSFEYPRRYAIETGDAAGDLLGSSDSPMNFSLPGGTTLAVVELPETGFANTDFSSALFDVSVNNRISEEDCGRFAVPETPVLATAPVTASAASPEPVAPVQNAASDKTVAKPSDSTTVDVKSNANSSDNPTTAPENAVMAGTSSEVAPAPKVMLSDMEMRKTEAVTGEGNRQSDTKYFHAYQNGACYEFALNVTTVASQEDGEMKHVDRDKIFNRLRGILATVKVNPIEAEKEAASAPAPAK